MPNASSVCRVIKNSNYTTMSNYHLRSKNLSLKAIGLLSKIFSLPEDWDYSISGLVAICKENETAVKSALSELKEWGYLVVTKSKSPENGRFVYIYDFYEYSEKDARNKPVSNKEKANKKSVINPETDNPYTENPGVENLPVEKLTMDNPTLENHGQLNTNKLNTNKLSTDNKIKKNKCGHKKPVKTAAPDFEKRIYGDNVLLTEKEYQILCSEHGAAFIEKCIETLSFYKLSSGKTYKSDFFAIKSWVIERVTQKFPNLRHHNSSPEDDYSNPFANID